MQTYLFFVIDSTMNKTELYNMSVKMLCYLPYYEKHDFLFSAEIKETDALGSLAMQKTS